MGIRVPVTVEMDDGRELKAVIDQRDYAAVEAAEIDPATHRNTWVRFLAWSALARTKQYGGPFEVFNTTDCVEATHREPEVPAGDEDGLDPGRKAPSAGS